MFAKPPGEVDHHHEVRLIRGARGLGRAPAEARQLAPTSEEGGEKKYWVGVRRNSEEGWEEIGTKKKSISDPRMETGNVLKEMEGEETSV